MLFANRLPSVVAGGILLLLQPMLHHCSIGNASSLLPIIFWSSNISDSLFFFNCIDNDVHCSICGSPCC